jgi:hypothetical protein
MELSRIAVAFSFGLIRSRINTNLIVYLLSIVVYLRSTYVYLLSILNTCGGTLITCARISFTCVQDNYSIKLLPPRYGTLSYSSGVPIWINSLSYKHQSHSLLALDCCLLAFNVCLLAFDIKYLRRDFDYLCSYQVYLRSG